MKNVPTKSKLVEETVYQIFIILKNKFHMKEIFSKSLIEQLLVIV